MDGHARCWKALAVTALVWAFAARLLNAQEEPRKTSQPPDQVTLELGPAVPLPVQGYALDLAVSAAPDDPDRLLVCTFENDGATRPSAAYVSLDAGSTWMRTLLDGASKWVSETSCATGASGRAYFVTSASDTSHGGLRHESGTMEAYRSLDGGLSWTGPHRYPFVDYTALAVLPSADMQKDKIYLFGNTVATGFGDAGSAPWLNRHLMSVSEDGLRYSLPVFPSEQNDASFPVGTAVTREGDVLALFGGGDGYALYRSDKTGYKLLSTITVPLRSAVNPLGAQIALDRSGRFQNRMYVVFQQVENNRYVLRLAVCDDGGKTWRLSTLLSGGTAAPMREANGVPYPAENRSRFAGIAVNREGIVGIEWQAPGACPLFAVSLDGGASVAKTVSLGNCQENEDLELLPDSVESHLWSLDDAGVQNEPGISIYVESAPQWGVKIAADSAGRFHTLWDEQKHDGKIVVLTATVTPHAGPLAPPHVFDLSVAKDVSEGAVFHLINYNFDAYTATFSVDLTLGYPDRGMPYPSFLEVVSGHSDCGKVAFVNTFAMSKSGAPVFRIPRGIRSASLFPGEQTLPIHLEATAAGCENEHGTLMSLSRRFEYPGKRLLSPLSVRFRVFVVEKPAK